MTEKKKMPLPFLVVLGSVLAACGLIATINGGTGWWLAPLGLVLLVVGLVQRSSAQRQVQHDELMAEMRRQRGE